MDAVKIYVTYITYHLLSPFLFPGFFFYYQKLELKKKFTAAVYIKVKDPDGAANAEQTLMRAAV